MVIQRRQKNKPADTNYTEEELAKQKKDRTPIDPMDVAMGTAGIIGGGLAGSIAGESMYDYLKDRDIDNGLRDYKKLGKQSSALQQANRDAIKQKLKSIKENPALSSAEKLDASIRIQREGLNTRAKIRETYEKMAKEKLDVDLGRNRRIAKAALTGGGVALAVAGAPFVARHLYNKYKNKKSKE